jgi:glycosyltransferase involved in cell wall biosynthesis
VSADEPIRLLRIISRLNVGGPAIQAVTMSRRLEGRGYETTLVHGVEGEREGSLVDLAEELGVRRVRLESLRRELGLHDTRALLDVVRIMRRVRPHVLHTHAAKAGTVGRVAAQLAGRARPQASVHTFHGHVLSGYFSRPREKAFTFAERALARGTSRLVAVSEEVRDDLIDLGVASRGEIAVVPLGFDLGQFALEADEQDRQRRAVHAELKIPAGTPTVTLVARLVPIKRVDRFLALANLVARETEAHFVIVGDGELARALQTSPAARALDGRLTWTGLRRDVPAIMAASDVVCLTSDNEGTPVSLIEAQAAGRPVVSTRVGGVPSAVTHGVTGYLAEVNRVEQLADYVRTLIDSRAHRERLGASGREAVLRRFSIERLTSNLDALYRQLLGK